MPMTIHRGAVTRAEITQCKADALAAVSAAIAHNDHYFNLQGRLRLDQFSEDGQTRVRAVADALGAYMRSGQHGHGTYGYNFPPLQWGHCGLSFVEVDAGVAKAAINWHQDYVAMGDLPAHQNGYTIWVPLDAIDGTRASLELVLQSKPPLLHAHDNREFRVIVDGEIGCGGTHKVVTDLDLGDVVVFNAWTLHRTFVTRSMTKPRMSFDLRYFEARNEE